MITKWLFNKLPCERGFGFVHSFLLESRAFGGEAGVIVKGRERGREHKSGKVNDWDVKKGLVYRNSVQFKIYRRFNATTWQSLKSTAQKTVTLRKILQL